MKRLLLAIAILLPLTVSAARKDAPSIVPAPRSIEMTDGTLNFRGIVINCDPALDKESVRAIRQFADKLSLVSGRTSSVASPVGLGKIVEKGTPKGLCFILDPAKDPEEYSIHISHSSAIVRASTFNGILYSLHTLRQMLPASVYGNKPDEKASWRVPCCVISDAPRFSWRGLHLDCSRHFWSVDEIKKLLDVMSVFKLNVFHWHLTDDQGWRIEIEKWPLLTEIGGFRKGTMFNGDFESCDNVRYGGWYTKDQMREVVAYAAGRGITVVPEVEIPGHMQAVLAAYPQFGCAGSQPQPYEVWTKWGVSTQVLNVGKEESMLFLEDVLAEVAEIFPGTYIHIGGDECPRDEWATDPDCQTKIAELGLKADGEVSAEGRLQNYVTSRMQDFLAGKGKKIIGWDEILEGELAPGATVMSWRGTEGGIKAASMGYDVIMAPTTYCYLDYVQAPDFDGEPYSITHVYTKPKDFPRAALTWEKLYSYDPLAEIPVEAWKHVLGVQANMWTEYISTPEHLEYMYFPRVLALAEVQWCQTAAKDEARFREDLNTHEFKVLDQLGINYRKPSGK